jgi:hypothetical protein
VQKCTRLANIYERKGRKKKGEREGVKKVEGGKQEGKKEEK